ncbi:hypothetical protein G4D82_11760 [Flavobacterium sp. CYK-4]|uniref:hypothetical protein n=1 Tax=Flavobacterium lotistagni TaxID=2709660 RepID=UPI0014079F7F|nr:hypothetical protein [Flavobacterium lotistagni]NHM07900.1 hypothetical protein [Flavobacterium lotistagni]
MKTTILLIATLLVLNQTEAKTFTTTENVASFTADIEQNDLFVTNEFGLDKRNFAPVEDQMIFNPAVVINNSYSKSIEEVIAQDNQIIESNIVDEGVRFYQGETTESQIIENNQIIDSAPENEIRPLYLDRTIEDQIAEGNAIIDNNQTSVYQPLDFEVINAKNNKQTQVNL